MIPSSKPNPLTIKKLLRTNRAVVTQTDPAERKDYKPKPHYQLKERFK